MMMLLDVLSCRDPEEILLPLESDGRETVGEVLSFVQVWRAEHQALRATAVSVGQMKSAELALVLCCLDGWASEIRLELDDEVVGIRLDGSGGACEIEDGVTRWLVPTSGTATGKSRWIAHDCASLSRSVKRGDGKAADLIWGLLFDLRRFAGIQVFMQALVGGAALAIPRVDDLESLPEVMHSFREVGVNALSATPSQWRLLLMAEALDGLDLQYVTLGGEPVDDRLLRLLRERFPMARVTHIYASTELGVGFSVSDGQSGFPVSYVEDGAVDRVRLRVGDDGCLWVHSGKKGWEDTGDLVERVGDRYHFLGRRGGLINVGGVKVSPEQVERVMLGVPGVGMALARAKASSIVGQVVEAFVVPESEGVDLKVLVELVEQACREKLERFGVPALVRVVDRLPVTDAGKMKRWMMDDG